MPDSVAKKGKRKTRTENPTAGFSGSLRVARDLVTSGKQSEGLTALNELAAATKNPTRLGKILTIVGESQASLSRHTEACAAFAKAAQYANQAQDYDLLLRAGYGQVRSLLRSQRITEAKTAASQLIADLNTADQAIQTIANLSPAQLASQGNVTLPARPPRSTVVLTKIGNAFYESGLTAEAQAFYTQAVQISPNGASRARQNLAKLALANDNPALAERYARESLLMGRFQAKTVAAWQLYLDARARQNLFPILEPDVLGAFKTNTKDRIAGASLLSIVRVLRAHGDPQWKSLAQEAVTVATTDSIIKTELEKILQGDAKLTGSESPRTIAASSLKLFRAGNVSQQEQIAHAKTYVHHSLLSGQQPAAGSIINLATTRFGIDHGNSVRHAMALGAMQAENHATAREWLLDLKTNVTMGSPAWGRATSALAKMDVLLERHSEAALLYLELANNNQTPARFRIQAMLLGFKQLVASKEPPNIDEVTVLVRKLLSEITDYRVAMDAARQLALAGNSLSSIKEEAALKGAELAAYEISKSTSSSVALEIHEYVSRKQYWDLRDYRSVVARWNTLTDGEKVEMRASGGSTWYEYCSLVLLSLAKMGKAADFSVLASSILDAGAATPEGYVIVGNVYAGWLLRNNEKTRAFSYFEWIAVEAPTHHRAASAHYWLSLRHLNNGETNAATSRALAVRLCFGGSPSLLAEWELDAKALLIWSGLSLNSASSLSKGKYPVDFLRRMLAQIEADRKLV